MSTVYAAVEKKQVTDLYILRLRQWRDELYNHVVDSAKQRTQKGKTNTNNELFQTQAKDNWAVWFSFFTNFSENLTTERI